MLQSRLRGRDGVTRIAIQRFRYQFAIGLLVAVIAPSLIRAIADTTSLQHLGRYLLLFDSIHHTLAASAIAMTLGLLLFRRLSNFPGVRSYEYVLPSFCASYGIVIAVLLISRVDYIISVLAVSFLLSLMTFFVVCYLTQRSAFHRFYVVPGGDISRLYGVRHADWVMMHEPILPATAGSGIVADLRADITGDWERMLADAALSGVPVYHLKQLLESLTGQVEIEHISENGLGSLNPDEGYGKVKHLADFVAAVLASILLLPAFALIAVAIRLDSPGPVFFRQQRMGFRGRPFFVFKFRTMRVQPTPSPDADYRALAITQDNDHRVTSVGRILRRTRIDELPQILNILRGEMSWIGPRPEAMPLSAWYRQEISFYSYRHVVRPGITGWAQVNQGHVAEISDIHYKLCYDFYYIKYRSAWLDALITFRTIRTIVSGLGAK